MLDNNKIKPYKYLSIIRKNCYKMKYLLIVILGSSLIENNLINGITTSHRSGSRIIGGSAAYAGQYPYAAAINVQTGTSKFFCAGSLISNLWILTAGQCVDGAILFTIQLGSNKLSGDDAYRVTVATSNYVLHPDYNPLTLENDIGLIELRMPVEFTSKSLNLIFIKINLVCQII
jgi:secreted trypsin-like serine protease